MSKTPWLIALLRPTYGASLLRRFQVRTEHFNRIPSEGPFLVIANHVHTYDPFFISAAARVHINWVAGRYLFKFRFLGYVLGRLIGAIAKQQGKSDLFTIRTIREKLAQGEPVGLFPEGTRTWDGDSLPVLDATAKMVKMFKVPVVVIHLKGAFGGKPRWALRRRYGPIILDVVEVLSPGEFARLNTAELTSRINSLLFFSHEQWQKEEMVPYRGRDRAEGVEDVLFACPVCSSFSTITAKGDTASCTSCGSRWRLDEYDSLVPLSAEAEAMSLAEWHRWESKVLEELFLSHSGENTLFPPDTGVLYQRIEEPLMETLSRSFTVEVFSRYMILSLSPSGKKVRFEYEDIASMAVNAKSTIEFSYRSVIYRMRLARGGSSLRYLEMYQLYQKYRKQESI